MPFFVYKCKGLVWFVSGKSEMAFPVSIIILIWVNSSHRFVSIFGDEFVNQLGKIWVIDWFEWSAYCNDFVQKKWIVWGVKCEC